MSYVKIDEELKKDVKKLFKTHSTEIVNVNDVFDVKEKLNLKVACNENDDIYPKLLKSKKEAQIILNLYKAPAIYKDLKVLSECDLENSCKDISNNDSSTEKPAVNDEKCSKDSPDENDESKVIDKLYQYVFYFLIAKHFEILEIFKSIPGIERIEYVKCSCCDTENEPTVWQCTACGDSLLSFYEAKIDEYERSKIKEKEDTISCNTESVVNKDLTSDDEKRREEPDSQVADKHVEKDLDWTKWKCKKCGLVNEDENVNCVVCMEARTDWICKQCTFINEMTREQCKICEESREGKANNKDDNNVKKEGIIDSWYCWYGKCKKRNDGNELYCTHCGLDKSANRERGAAVDMNKFGEKQQVWICYACGNINNDLRRLDCDKCFEWKVDGKGESNKDKINADINKSCEDKANNKDDNNVKKEGIIDSWNCWYGKCKKRNYGNELYCTHCGLDKSANRERGAAVEMNKFGEKQQVWICYACGNINNDLSRLLCQKCFEWKVDVKGESNKDKINADINKSCEKLETWTCCKCGNSNNDLTRSICQRCGVSKVDIKGESDVDHIISSYEVIESGDVNKWRCKQCECVNGEECLSCKPCQSPRLEIWSCKQCTMRNKISEDHCAACGEVNENRITKHCSECKRGEIICDDLCGDCLKVRNETWTCSYRFCENRNPGNVKYCKDCGLDRDARKIDIGAPMWRCTGDVPREIWICDKCYAINDISRYLYLCQNYSCHGKNKYTKKCYKCEYKYNHDSSKHCKMCQAKIS